MSKYLSKNLALLSKVLILSLFFIPLAYAGFSTDFVTAGNVDVRNNTISATNTNGGLTFTKNGNGNYTFTGLTADRVLVSGASGILLPSSVTPTQLENVEYLDIGSSLTGLLDDKVSKSGDTMSGSLVFEDGLGLQVADPGDELNIGTDEVSVVNIGDGAGSYLNALSEYITIGRSASGSTVLASPQTEFLGDVQVDKEWRITQFGNSDYVGFKAPSGLSNTQIWTLPAADGDSGEVLSTDGNGVLSWVAPSVSALTANRAVVTDGSGLLTVSSITDTVLGYLSGVTSGIQTQIDSKITNPMTTQGDIIVGGTSGAPARKAIGSIGQTLIVNAAGTGLDYGPQSAMRPVYTATNPYTADGTRQWIGANSGSDQTITLPDATTVNAGSTITVQKIGIPGTITTITVANSGNIEGKSAIVLSKRWQSVKFMAQATSGSNVWGMVDQNFAAEVVSSGTLTRTSQATGTWGDLGYITITPGVWSIRASSYYGKAVGSTLTKWASGIGLASGTSASGLTTQGVEYFDNVSSSFDASTGTVSIVVSPTTTTSYFLKTLANYTGSAGTQSGIIEATRIGF